MALPFSLKVMFAPRMWATPTALLRKETGLSLSSPPRVLIAPGPRLGSCVSLVLGTCLPAVKLSALLVPTRRKFGKLGRQVHPRSPLPRQPSGKWWTTYSPSVRLSVHSFVFSKSY